MIPTMILHVAFGTLAVLSGATALIAPKGAPVHRAAGKLFVFSMLITALAGAWTAYLKPEMITLLAGLFTCYLVVTSWATLQAHRRWAASLSLASPLIAAAICAAGILFAREALGSATGLKNGFDAEPYFIFGGLAGLAALLDISVVLRRGISGRQRIARHVWRMGFALFIAVGSLFTGPGASAFPDGLRGSAWLSLPELFVLVSIIAWLAITAFTKRFRAAIPISVTPP